MIEIEADPEPNTSIPPDLGAIETFVRNFLLIPISSGSPNLSTSALHIGQGYFRPGFLSWYCCHARSETRCPHGRGARSRTGSSSVPIRAD